MFHKNHSLQGYEVLFKDINVTINKKEILKNVNGRASPGEMLAILGPSGAGKTTLLNCLAGRRSASSGTITLNSKSPTKQLMRKISYLIQQDIFLTNLTCWETLWYTAMLRLPGSMPTAEKESLVYEIVDALDMRKCLETKIGDNVVRGLSGGEKKRTSIACELLTNPALMLLDEPTSGLDSSTAFSFCSTLRRFARTSGKTVIISIHQPSSHLLGLFDKLLLLCEGQVAYYGDVEKCVDYFKDLDLPCPANYNLADHLLDVVKGSADVKIKVLEAADTDLRSGEWCQSQNFDKSIVRKRFAENGRSANSHEDDEADEPDGGGGHVNEAMNGDGDFSITVPSENGDLKDEDMKYAKEYNNRWPTSFLLQYSVLYRRSFKQTWSRTLNRWNLIQFVVIGLLTGMLWFQIEAIEERIKDRQGLLFFLLILTSLTSTIAASSSYAPVKVLLNKERLAGYYRLSAYYLASLSSDLSLILFLPSIFTTIAFWLSGLSLNFSVYLMTLCVILLNVTVCHSIGGLLSVSILELPVTMMATTTTIIYCFIAGGFYTERVAPWAIWMKYISFFQYAFNALLKIEYSNNDIRCAHERSSIFPACLTPSTAFNGSTVSGDSNLVHHIPKSVLLAEHTSSLEGWLLWHDIVVLLAFSFLMRFSTYLVLRYIRKPQIA